MTMKCVVLEIIDQFKATDQGQTLGLVAARSLAWSKELKLLVHWESLSKGPGPTFAPIFGIFSGHFGHLLRILTFRPISEPSTMPGSVIQVPQIINLKGRGLKVPQEIIQRQTWGHNRGQTQGWKHGGSQGLIPGTLWMFRCASISRTCYVTHSLSRSLTVISN